MELQKDAGTSSAWSVIARAQGTGPEARAALGELIRRYEGSVVTLLDALRCPPDRTPEDIKQEFFAKVLGRGDIMRLNRERGRFRGWLRRAVKSHLANAWKEWRAEKRGNLVETASSLDHPNISRGPCSSRSRAPSFIAISSPPTS